MTLEELKQKTKHELMGELMSDLTEGKETEIIKLLKVYLDKRYHLIERDVKIEYNQHKDYVIDIILNTISESYNVKPEEIKGKSRKAPLPDARHVYFYVAKELAHETLPLTLLGNVINRDHSTGVHARKKIKNIMERDVILAERVDKIIGACKIKLGGLKNN